MPLGSEDAAPRFLGDSLGTFIQGTKEGQMPRPLCFWGVGVLSDRREAMLGASGAVLGPQLGPVGQGHHVGHHEARLCPGSQQGEIAELGPIGPEAVNLGIQLAS